METPDRRGPQAVGPSGVITWVCEPIHTHTKLLRKIKVTIYNHQADSTLNVWPDVLIWWLASSKTYGHTWHPTVGFSFFLLLLLLSLSLPPPFLFYYSCSTSTSRPPFPLFLPLICSLPLSLSLSHLWACALPPVNNLPEIGHFALDLYYTNGKEDHGAMM